jgi:hypothetical protein
MYAAAYVFKHVLSQIRYDFPDIKQLICRSDNAGCYSGASIVTAQKQICEDVGIDLKYVHFCESQIGKDQCDRDAAVAKSYFRTFVNGGVDLLSAKDMKTALDQSLGGLRSSKVSVFSVLPELGLLNKVSISNVSTFHTIQF